MATTTERMKAISPSALHPNYSVILPFEETFVYEDTREWMERNFHTAFYWVAAYMVFIFFGQAYMSSRPAFRLKGPLVIWNLALAVFSIIGTFRTLPEMLHVLRHLGLQHSVCSPSYIENGVSGLWSWLFALSKVPELGDTVFIVLRKQNLIFLHWYHHITVLLFTWQAYAECIGPGRWYICMNYVVHSMMYSYYFLRALGVRVPKNIAMIVTSSQIVQMIFGCFVTYYSYLLNQRGEMCQISEATAKVALTMYGSYFVLFAKFFINSYFGPGKNKKRTTDKDKPQTNGTANHKKSD